MTVGSFSVLIPCLLLNLAPVHSPAITINNPSPAAVGFGQSIDSAEGLLMVGANYETAFPSNDPPGQAWIFDAKTGSMIRTLVSPNPIHGGQFGWSVEIARGLFIVGAPGETVSGMGRAGRVYFFSVRTGALVDTLVSPNAQPGGQFGWSVAESNGLLTVGAPFETPNRDPGAGRVYLFNLETRSLTGTLVSPSAQFMGEFGERTYISDDRVIVSAPGEDVVGRAYVFSTATGALVSTLVTPNSGFRRIFAWSVALANQLAFVGSPSEDRVYVFNATTGSLIRTIIDPNTQTSGAFGYSIALWSYSLIVGAPVDFVNGVNAGRVYIFDAATGTLTNTLDGPAASSHPNFGYSVDSTSRRVYAGAPTQTVNGQINVGAAYIFSSSIGHSHFGNSPPLDRVTL